MKDKRFDISLNPLLFAEFDNFFKLDPNNVSLDTTLGFLCWPGSKRDLTSLHERYNKITSACNQLLYAPVENTILDKIVWPLRQAKANFVLANFIGTISLCGYVAEMMSILIYDMTNIQLNGSTITEEQEKLLFGSKFEKLGQDKRIKVLLVTNLIDQKVKSDLDNIKRIRKKYLHYLSESDSNLEDDSIKIFKSTVDVLIYIIGQEIEEEKFKLNESMFRYLKSKELLK
jgi:hypothetical protein